MIDLHEFELIKQLKYRYFRALDTKNWELMRSCLTADAVARYDGGKYSFDGRDNIVSFFQTFLESPQLITLHQGHHPELDLIDSESATGIWYLEDIVINLDNNSTLRGAGFYSDQYVKIDKRWQIKVTGYERTYEEIEKRGEGIKITNNSHLKK